VSGVEPTGELVPFPPEDVERSIPERFESVARRLPDRVAVRDAAGALTYEALNRDANRVAHAVLDALGPGEGSVALLLEQGAPAIAAILGVLKAGKSYVPLDASAPRAPLDAIVQEVAPRLVVTRADCAALAAALLGDADATLDLDAALAGHTAADPGLPIAPDALAEIVYTSGSTGRPKGVMQTHRNLLHHAMRVGNRFRLAASDRMTLLASLHAGQARTVMYRAVLNGAGLHVRDLKVAGLTGLADWLRDEGITIFSSSASVFRGFVDTLADGEDIPTLRLIRVGSEAVSTRDVERYRERFGPHTLLVNALSSTETGVTRIFFMDRATPLPDGAVPVGHAVDGMEVLLLDDDGAPVRPGETGEIVVRSRYLSPGYWARPELTAAAFGPDPAGGDARVYRTGDVGRLTPDGCLVHLGRKDFRVKVRGHRIEPGEVEHALRGHASIKDVAVMTQPDHAGEPRLVAYVVPEPSAAPRVRELREFSRERLPGHMVPSVFLLLPSLPLTSSGKVDRQRLPVPARLRPIEAGPYVAPRTPVESALAELWAAALGIDAVGIHDEFLDLGGESLTAMRLLARVHEVFHLGDAPVRALSEAATIERMARAVTERLARALTPEQLARALADDHALGRSS
jgi:amino acid adenylation domain-containing protein